ncbi:hypothetical protein [Sulfuracidifex metallicus]|uniref:hypothetical protein n=1 Tax=Sulfuracidifex metallicus TaxID=47303 RepID=UPI002275A670|nr:hypothetical protein [Sulfuracidifex metallicus]MCY0850104.1 hypothetical protein [Sulfuracidifex metallicus]
MEWRINNKVAPKVNKRNCDIDEIASMEEIMDKLRERSHQFAVDVSIKVLKEKKMTLDELSRKYNDIEPKELERLVELVKQKLEG